jgi:hypothetical protein
MLCRLGIHDWEYDRAGSFAARACSRCLRMDCKSAVLAGSRWLEISTDKKRLAEYFNRRRVSGG